MADGGIYDAYIILDTNNSLTYIKADNFQNMIFDNPSQLILKGGQIKTWKNDNTNIWYGHIYYRIYQCNQTPPEFDSIKLNWLSDDGTNNGSTNQTWENKDSTINLLQGLAPGIYQIEIYFTAYDGDNDVYYYYSNYGNNFKARIIVYNKSQNTGNWSDANTWLYGVPQADQPVMILSNHSINLDQNATVSILKIYGSLSCDDDTLTFDSYCPIQPDSLVVSGTFEANTSLVNIKKFTYITGNLTFNNISLSTGINFGDNSTVIDTLTILENGYIDSYSPKFSTTGGIKYNTGTNYTRSFEWPDNTGNIGEFPNFVIITGNTSLDLNTTNSITAGKLTIDPGSTLAMSSTTQEPLVIKGDVNIKGNYIFSQEIGGDLKVEGNLQKESSAYIDWGGDGASDKGRALFMSGNGIQHITNIDTIPYLLIENSSHTVFDNDIVINGNGTQFLSLYDNAILDLNGHTLTSLASGRIEVDGANGPTAKLVTGKPNSRIIFTGSSDGTVYQLNNGTLTIDTNVTIAVQSGTLDFGDNITDLYGTVEIRGSASIANDHYPVYHEGSTLKYVNTTDVTTSAEWPNTNGPSNIWIASTKYKKVSLNEDKTISGTLIFQSGTLDLNGYNLTYADGSTLEYRIPSDTVYTISDTNAQEWGQNTALPYNVILKSGKVELTAKRAAQHNLSIDTGSVFFVKYLTGQLTVNDTLLVNTNASLVLESDNSTAPSGSLWADTIINNGQTIAQRFFFAKHFAYLTPPNASTNSSLFNNNPNGTFNRNFYAYNESFDAVPDPSDATYSQWTDTANHFSDAWMSLVNTDLDTPGKGYAYYNDVNRTIEFNGTFLTNDQTITLSAHYNDANNGYFDGWNLIANPFTCALDWDSQAWDKTAIEDVIYYWDPNDGNYKYYSASGNYDDGSNTVNGGSEYIPAMQGFFIKVKDGYNGTKFTIPAAARVHSDQNFWEKAAKKQSNFIKLKANFSNHYDETVIRFIEQADKKIDDFDVYKLITPAKDVPQIFSFFSINQPELAINSLPSELDTGIIPLGVEIKTDSFVNIDLSLEKSTVKRNIYLFDSLTKKQINLLATPNIKLDSISNGYTKDRFFIKLCKNNSPKLIKQLPDRQIPLFSEFYFKLDTSIFYDPDFGDKLNFSIQVINPPQWLKIDTAKLCISGQANGIDSFTVAVLAKDLLGSIASDTFSVKTYQISTNSLNTCRVAVYPNPAENIITISADSDFEYSITTLAGKLILQGKASNKKVLDISDLNKGYYIIKIKTSKPYYFKILKL